MDKTPTPSPASEPTSTPPSGSKARMIAVVALAGAVAAGTMLLLRPGKTPDAPKAPEKAASASAPAAPAPAPVPPAPKLYSELLGDFELPTAMGPLSLKGLKSVDSTLPKADIEAILKGNTSLLAKLDAKAITLDSMSWAQTIGGKTSITTYEGVSASAVKAGVIGSLTAQRGTGRGESGKAEAGDKSHLTETTMEEISLASFDLPLMLRWFNEVDPDGKTALAPLHGAYRIKSMKVVTDKVQVDFGPIALSGSSVRPARRAVSTILTEMRKLSEDAKAEAPKVEAPKPDAPKDGTAAPAAPATKPDAYANENAIIINLIDLMASFEIGEGTLDTIKITGKETKPEEAFSSEIRKVSLNGGAKARVALDGLSVKAADGTFALGKVEMGGDLLSLTMLGADKAIRDRASVVKPGDEELRALIKTQFGKRPISDITFTMEGMNGDFPATKNKPEAGRVTFDMKRAAFLIGNFVALTPTKIDYVLDGVNVPMPKESKDATVLALRAMGIDRLVLSARIAAGWAEAGEKLSFQEISMDVAQLARLAITGEMSAVPRAFFEDPQRNWPSAMGATINSLAIDIENKGGLAKLVDMMAKEQKKTGEQLRNEFANIAPLVIAGMLAGHPDNGKVAQAVSNFIRNLNGLNLKVTPAGPNGIVLTDLVLASKNPAEFAQKLRFEMEGK